MCLACAVGCCLGCVLVCAGQLQRMRDDELSKRASEPLPLADYYDEVLLLPDLDKFEPGSRCRAEHNGEGDVLLADVSVDVPLHATSFAGIQVRY